MTFFYFVIFLANVPTLLASSRTKYPTKPELSLISVTRDYENKDVRLLLKTVKPACKLLYNLYNYVEDRRGTVRVRHIAHIYTMKQSLLDLKCHKMTNRPVSLSRSLLLFNQPLSSRRQTPRWHCRTTVSRVWIPSYHTCPTRIKEEIRLK